MFFHISHLFHIWGTIGTKLKEPNDPYHRQFEMLQNKQMEKLTFNICMLPFYKGLKIHLKVKGPCRVQSLCTSQGSNICTSHYPRVQISKFSSFSAIVSDPCFSLFRLCNRINRCHSSIPAKETRSANIQKISY